MDHTSTFLKMMRPRSLPPAPQHLAVKPPLVARPAAFTPAERRDIVRQAQRLQGRMS